ncbi:MAG: SagB/ThcOx family dehydrogenase [archaeon]|nr:SagB/ThcOx family dehydrogenase [archaeon]
MGIKLEEIDKKGAVSVEEAIARRKSRRSFKRTKLTRKQLSQLIWSAGKAPSAGATYPLELYVVIGADCAEDIDAGIYHTERGYSELEVHKEGDLRTELADACLSQMFIAHAPVSFVIAAEYERTTRRYGDRGVRYVLIEVGHVSQNIYLECEALGLATVAIGAFHDEAVARVLSLPREHRPLYVMPVGVSAGKL